MARVPTYDTPQEREAPLPNARVESVASPALFDAGADALSALGKGVVTAGVGAEQVAYHMRQRENADVLFSNESADKEAYLAYEAGVRQDRQGNSAKGVTTDTATWWKQRIDKNSENMTEEQQRLYKMRMMPVQLQSVHGVSQFEAHQLEVAHDQSWNADKSNTINLAAATPTPGVVATSVKEIQKFNAYQGARKGWSPEALQAENGKDITKLHAQAIQTLAKDSPTLAAAYFKEHEMEIDGSMRAEIGLFAQKATAAKVGAAAAQTEWEANGPKGDNDAASIDVMKKNLREKLKDDPFARDVALTELSHIDSDRDKSIKARDNNRQASVNTMLMNNIPLARVMQTPAWAALDGTEQKKIKEGHEAYLTTSLDRLEHEKTVRNVDIAMKLSDPEKLAAMTRNEVVNLLPVLGRENTQRLLEKWDLFTKGGTHLTEAKLDNDQFNAFATRAGLDPNTKNDAMKKQIVDTRDQVERIIASEQQNKKRPLTREEKDKILQQQIDNKVMQHNTIWRDEAKPVITLPDNKQSSAYVVVNGTEVRLSSIPADYRAQITAARRERGLPTTEKIVAELWMKKQATQKTKKIEEQGGGEGY